MAADVAEVVWYNEDSASPLTVSKPAAFASGQILVAVFCAHGTTLADMTAPTGWTASGTTWQVAGVTYGKVFYHVFVGGDPATWDFPYGAGDDVALGLFRITGADTTPTIVVTATPITSLTSSDDSPTVTPTGVDDLLICTLANIGNGTAFVETDPSGMTDQSQTQVAGNNMALAGASQQLASGSATGVRTWTSVTPTGVGGGTFSIAVKSTGAASQGQVSSAWHPGRGPSNVRFYQSPRATSTGGNVVNIDGSLTVTATRTATVAVTHVVSGSLTVTANRTATVAVTHTIGGSRPTTVNRTATIAVTHTVSGSLVVTASRAATVAVTHTIGGSRPTTVNRTATVAVTHTIGGSRPTTVNRTATVAVTHAVGGSLVVTASRTVTVAVVHTVSGSLIVVVTRSADAGTSQRAYLFLPFFG